MTEYDRNEVNKVVRAAALLARNSIGNDVLFQVRDSETIETEGKPERYVFRMVCTKDDEFDLYRVDFGSGYMTLSTRGMSEHNIHKAISGFCKEFLDS